MWNKECSQIFLDIINRFNEKNIEYFLLRNSEGLPDYNDAKDVDIVVNPKKIRLALATLKAVYKQNNCEYYFATKFDTLHCTHGINLKEKYGIHIDLLKGISIKGYSIYPFEKLYEKVETVNGINVLDSAWENALLLITKLFGNKNPVLKEKYALAIKQCTENNREVFEKTLELLLGKKGRDLLLSNVDSDIYNLIRIHKKVNWVIKRNLFFKSPVKSIMGITRYKLGKIKRIIISYRKYMMVCAFLGPDGVGKSSLINETIKKVNYYLVNDEKDKRVNLVHFRPNLLPNLGALGERAGVMEQDKNWTNPHRGKPANTVSSFFRMLYYTLDYIIGWRFIVRNDVRFERFTFFDRYGFDFLVDPLRSKIKLPYGIRKILVSLMPKPQLTFILEADYKTIYTRKKEISEDEIKRQLEEYRKISKRKNTLLVSTENEIDKITDEVTETIFDKFFEKL